MLFKYDSEISFILDVQMSFGRLLPERNPNVHQASITNLFQRFTNIIGPDSYNNAPPHFRPESPHMPQFNLEVAMNQNEMNSIPAMVILIITYHLSFLSSDWSIDRVKFNIITCHITCQKSCVYGWASFFFSNNYVIK